MKKLIKFSCILMFCLCKSHIAFSQSEPVPFWYNDRNQLKEGNNFTYAVGVGYGTTNNDAEKEALDIALKQAEAYLRGLNIPQSDIDSRMLKIRMNDSSNASWTIVCLKEFKINNDDTRHKVYILYRFKKDIYKEFGDNDATIDCDLNFDVKRAEYYQYLNNTTRGNNNRSSNEQKNTSQVPVTNVGEMSTSFDNNSELMVGKSYELKIGTKDFFDFMIVTPTDGFLTLSLESFAERTCFALYNQDGISAAPTNRDIVSGQWSGYPWGESPRGIDYKNDKIQVCYWNDSAGRFKGNFTFVLEAGTYKLRITRSETGLSTAKLSIQFQAMR